MDLSRALESGCSYAALGTSFRQWLSEKDFIERTLMFHTEQGHCYDKLPSFIRESCDKEQYYAQLVRVKKDQLQLYPYALQRQISQFASVTPLSYYTTMLARLVSSRRSYDELPNFTATDIAALLCVGRNEYLQLSKELGNRDMPIDDEDVLVHLPAELRGVTTLQPFDSVFPVPLTPAIETSLARCDTTTATLYHYLLRVEQGLARDTAVAGGDEDVVVTTQNLGIPLHSLAEHRMFCVSDLPQTSLLHLYRRGLVLTHTVVKADDVVTISPLDHFVMNRAASTSQEVLLYRVMSTIDTRVPLRVQAQLLMLPDEELCAAISVLVHLGLVVRSAPTVTLRSHTSSPIEAGATPRDDGCVSRDTSQSAAGAVTELGTGYPTAPLTTTAVPPKRIALLYDATLSGFLMMTNLSNNPAFKRYAVTLFEVGKLPDEMLDGFLPLLALVDDPGDGRCRESMPSAIGAEEQRYVSCVRCLHKLLSILRDVRSPSGTRGVDMLKIEAVNEWEATTRYTLLGRYYWAYIVATPTACVPRVGPEMQPTHGSTVTLLSSPWLVLYLYTQMQRGPPTILLPRGCLPCCWPSIFSTAMQTSSMRCKANAANCIPNASLARHTPTLRLQPLALDAEVCELDVRSALIQVCEKAAISSLCVQYCSTVQARQHSLSSCLRTRNELQSDGELVTVEVAVPFVATTAQIERLIAAALQRRMCCNAAVFAVKDGGRNGACNLCSMAIQSLQLQDTAGYFTLRLSAILTQTTVQASTTAAKADARPASGPSGTRDASATGEKDDELSGKAMSQYRWHEGEQPVNAPDSMQSRGNMGELTTFYEAYPVASYIVGVSLGVPLDCDACFAIVAEALPRLLQTHARERHADAMHKLTDSVGLLIEKYSLASRAHQSELAVQSSALIGPMTMMHFRRDGDDEAGVPQPSFTLIFNGEELCTLDELDACM